MDSLDLLYGIVIVVFFAMIISVGVYSRKNTKDVSSFVLGGRKLFSSDMQVSSDGTSVFPLCGSVLAMPSSVLLLHGSFSVSAAAS